MSKLSALPLPSLLLSAIIELPAFTPFPPLPLPLSLHSYSTNLCQNAWQTNDTLQQKTTAERCSSVAMG